MQIWSGGLITQLRWYYVRPTKGTFVILRYEESDPSIAKILRWRSE